MKKAQEKELVDSLQFIDQLAERIKKEPNLVWSGRQAKLFKSVYASINENWRKSE